MAPRKRTSVFISYARVDAADLAQRLSRDLTHAGFDAWLDTQRLPAGATWTTEIEREIDRRPLMLALLTPGSFRSDICRAEQLRALRQGARVIPLLAQKGTDIPLHLETKHYRDFTGASLYPTALRTPLADIRAGKGHVPLKEQYRRTYVTAPPLPRNYVERPDALSSLRARLVTDGGGPSIALTALKGMGGIGKSVLAQALCHDPVVQQAFPDGVVWVAVGRQPTYDLVTRMRGPPRLAGCARRPGIRARFR